MPTSLPTEVIELVIDFVAGQSLSHERTEDLRACCLASRNLVARCQMHIFQTVTLYGPPSCRRGIIPPTEYLSQYSRTLALASLLGRKSHLADLVRCLTFKITSPFWNSPSNNAVQIALGSLSNVHTFHLIYDDGDLSPHHQRSQFNFASTPATWIDSVQSIMRSPKCERVAVDNISGWPSELLFARPNLRDVHLITTSITLSETDGAATPPQCQLRSLSCDFSSLQSGVNRVLAPFYETSTPNQPRIPLLPELEELRIDVGAQQGSGSLLLRQAHCLRSLCMAVEVTLTTPAIAYPCPLEVLHPESFFTLKQLEVCVHIHLDRPNMMVDSPYGCDWSKTLNKMTHLERFKIHVIFQGHLDVHPASFGQQWGQIFGAPIPSSTPLKLQRVVELIVQAKTVAREVPGEVRGNDAICFIDSIRRHVYPSQFLGLKDASEGFPVRFSFKSEAIIQNADCRCWRHRGVSVR